MRDLSKDSERNRQLTESDARVLIDRSEMRFDSLATIANGLGSSREYRRSQLALSSPASYSQGGRGGPRDRDKAAGRWDAGLQ